MIERLRRLVAIPSVSRDEERIADQLSSELAAGGMQVRRSGNNLWCAVGDSETSRLLLNSHLDTVPPAKGWTVDPWTPTLGDENRRLCGLGSNDAKGAVTAMVEAVLAWKRRLDRGASLGGTVVLALTAEEEIGGQGLSTIREELGVLDAALVGEPTGLVPMIAQRGLLILRGVARGRSQHAGNSPPGRADNAIINAARDLSKLGEFDWGARHPLLGRAHGNVTVIEGGAARNVIPDECLFYLDIRTTPLETHPKLTQRLSRYLDSEIQVHSDRLVPVGTSPAEPIVEAVLRALSGTEAGGSATMSDMVFLADVPCVKIGPGESSRSHCPDEHIFVDELEAGAAAYERIIGEFFHARAEGPRGARLTVGDRGEGDEERS